MVTTAAIHEHQLATPGRGWKRVVVVASTGGIQALIGLVSGLNDEWDLPISVVLHRKASARTPDALVKILEHYTNVDVCVAVQGAPACQPGITVMPGHTMVAIDARGCWTFGNVEWNNRPGDRLLESSAALGPTIAVILTGPLSDGSQGCRAVKLRGGLVIVQDPQEARAPEMPTHAIATGCADAVLPTRDIGAMLSLLTGAR
ncbi:two-component system chemotaxis response regulator CheB [Mycolicibacterium sp. BK634]|uniref:chemotaxis protein CheB n=1 Tax=Mycolicibacterium sp. BK634 TaxID=2587099 RepID=UPI00160B48FA|nr:chemotaxis protein CheB [Mycolicibacterium sp. BK634]MBB3752711.1 two-component system chemotaxis response regulator CheB [Mycolicibacterium sp. BK634]